MKRKQKFSFLGTAFLSAAIGILVLAADVRSECPTQGAFALALAQILEFNVSEQDAAASALAGDGIAPLGGWEISECLTADAVIKIYETLQKAVEDKLVKPELAHGAVVSALSAIHAEEFQEALNLAIPESILVKDEAIGGDLGSQIYPLSNHRP